MKRIKENVVPTSTENKKLPKEIKVKKQKPYKKKRFLSYEKKQGYVGFLFILPWFLGFIMFFLIPLVKSLMFSLSNVATLDNYKTTWNNFKNYYDMLMDVDFVSTLTGTLTDLLVNVPIILIFSLFVAVLLNRKFIGRGVARAIFFLPVIVTTGVVMTAINAGSDATSAFAGDALGGTMLKLSNVDSLLMSSGLPESIIEWMTAVSDKIFSIIWNSGIQILLFLAALQGISPSLYEASDVEGATGWETFWLITFPNVAPIILVNLVYSIVDTFSSTDNKLLEMIQNKLNIFNFGLAAAMSWTYFLIIFAVIGLVYLLINKLMIKD